MFSRLFGWGKWYALERKYIDEDRIWVDHDPYGGRHQQKYRWRGYRVTYWRKNKWTGKEQYRIKEYN